MQIQVTQFNDETARDQETDLCKVGTVVVSNGRLMATYTFRELLGGGLKFCVDSQIEFNTNVREAAIQQFRLDCTAVVGQHPFIVDAGHVALSDGEHDCKYYNSFSSYEEAERCVLAEKLNTYEYCHIVHKDKIIAQF